MQFTSLRPPFFRIALSSTLVFLGCLGCDRSDAPSAEHSVNPKSEEKSQSAVAAVPLNTVTTQTSSLSQLGEGIAAKKAVVTWVDDQLRLKTAPLAAEDFEALNFAESERKARIIEIGDRWTVQLSNGIWEQYKDVTYQIGRVELTEADRLNGVSWIRNINARCAAQRTKYPRTDLHPEAGTWLEWQSQNGIGSQVLSGKLWKKNGEIAWSTSPWEGRPFTYILPDPEIARDVDAQAQREKEAFQKQAAEARRAELEKRDDMLAIALDYLQPGNLIEGELEEDTISGGRHQTRYEITVLEKAKVEPADPKWSGPDVLRYGAKVKFKWLSETRSPVASGAGQDRQEWEGLLCGQVERDGRTIDMYFTAMDPEQGKFTVARDHRGIWDGKEFSADRPYGASFRKASAAGRAEADQVSGGASPAVGHRAGQATVMKASPSAPAQGAANADSSRGSGVKDTAALFTPAAAEKAAEVIRRIKQNYGMDLLVQTYDSPPEIRAKSSEDAGRQYKAWTMKEADAAGVNGLYIQFFKPGGIVVEICGDKPVVFNESDREKLSELLGKLPLGKENDRKLLDAVDFVEATGASKKQ